ncbi:MAG: ATP-binding protein [Polyangiales bacterium]
MATPWFGQRAHIVLALCSVFLLSFCLLGFAMVQIARQNAVAQRVHAEQLLEHTLAPEWSTLASPAAFQAACSALRAHVPGVSARLARADGVQHVCGVGPGSPRPGSVLAGGVRLSVRLPDGTDQATRHVTRLLLFYMGLTGLAVALFAYALLTQLIVRPLERLTRSAEHLAHGMLHEPVPERGSAEAVRLARTFNRMATLLLAERKALTDRLAELERTTGELQMTQRQLIHGEKLASVGRLAAGIAHEIGNPLTAIGGLVELLRDGELSAAESREFCVRIGAETDRIHGIIRGLLDYARTDAASDPHASCELGDAIDDAVRLVRPQKASRAVHIDIAITPHLGAVVGARARLTQVVLNLLLNALDALDGAGRIEISALPDPSGPGALLRVCDDGPGIAPEIASHLFEPFSTTKPAGKGTGLGLAVTHTIVEGLGGSMKAWNLQEGGACFEVRLPHAAAALPARAAAV